MSFWNRFNRMLALRMRSREIGKLVQRAARKPYGMQVPQGIHDPVPSELTLADFLCGAHADPRHWEGRGAPLFIRDSRPLVHMQKGEPDPGVMWDYKPDWAQPISLKRTPK